MKEQLRYYLTNHHDVKDLRLIQEEDIIIAHFKSGDKTTIHEYKVTEGQFNLYHSSEDKWHTLNNGRTTTSGPTEVSSESSADESVKGLVRNVLIKNKFNMIDNYISKDKYNQHNYELQFDGLQALKDYKEKDPEMLLYDHNELIVIDGDFGYARSWLNWEKDGKAMKTIFHDIFRTEKNMITEHWDVISREER